MTELYFHSTPNSMKAALLLEELNLTYDLKVIDIFKGEQHSEEYRQINPNGKVPAYRDGEITVFDSHAILLYVARQHKQFLPEANQDYASMLSWLQMIATGLSPFSGQAVHFLHYAPTDIEYAKHRYVKEVERHYQVLDDHLAKGRYLTGDQYTIADMALWGWAISAKYIFSDRGLNDYPNVSRLVHEISERPAALRTLAIRERTQVKTEIDEESRKALFHQ